MSNLRIFEVTKEGKFLERLVELRSNCDSWFFKELSFEESRRKFLSNLISENHRQYIALKNGNSVGGLFVSIGMMNADCELSIYVPSSYQRQGIGSKLVKRAIKDLKIKGHNEVCGYIFPTNEQSFNFVAKNGFYVDKRMNRFRDGYRASLQI